MTCKTPDVNDIVTFRMTTGEEVIGKYLGEYADHFSVESPLILMQGQGGLQLVPMVYSGDVLAEPVPLYKSAVMLAVKSKEDAADHWRQVTTGLVTPQKQIITG